MEKMIRKMFYRFIVLTVWIFGWHILLALEIKERLSKRRNEDK